MNTPTPPEPKRDEFADEEHYILALRAHANCLRGLYEIEQAHNIYLTKMLERHEVTFAALVKPN